VPTSVPQINAQSPMDNNSFSRLIEGVNKFRGSGFKQHRELFRQLATKQQPNTLFICCADSRVVPEMMTQTDPGELFLCRNIGNVVPAYGEMLGGVSAVIEYACVALEVSDVVVCALRPARSPDHPVVE
jgi:carbonic anhydrase